MPKNILNTFWLGGAGTHKLRRLFGSHIYVKCNAMHQFSQKQKENVAQADVDKVDDAMRERRANWDEEEQNEAKL